MKKWMWTAAASLLTLIIAVPVTAIVLDKMAGDALPENAVAHALHSEVLGGVRELVVSLPESYQREPERRYPVVYVLDGSSHVLHTARSAALMARIGAIPELIVVGLSSGDERVRDYTPPFMRQDVDDPASPHGEGDKFVSFLEAEAVPFIERSYRTAPGRILAGHSRSGLLVYHALTTRPLLFDGWLVHSAPVWREDYVLVNRLGEFLKANTFESFLYVSVGSEENPNIKGGFERVQLLLNEAQISRSRWRMEVIGGADHQKNAEMAMPLAFAAFYQAAE